MYKQFGGSFADAIDRTGLTGSVLAQTGPLDALVALERIGSRRSFSRDDEIYAEGDASVELLTDYPHLQFGFVLALDLTRAWRSHGGRTLGPARCHRYSRARRDACPQQHIASDAVLASFDRDQGGMATRR
jgi:hypothetical protein